MSELSPETKALIEEAREARLPDRARVASAGVELQEELERLESRPLPIFARQSLALVVVLLCLIVASTVAAYGIISGAISLPSISAPSGPTTPPSPRAPSTPSRDAVPSKSISGSRVETPPRTEQAPPRIEEASPEADSIREVERPHEGDQAPRSARRSRPRVAGSSEPTSSESESTPPIERLAPETLAEETGLLHRAEAALRGDQPREALRILDEHGRRFPRGTLSLERRAARLVARCQLGSTDSLREQARLFVSRHPGSIYTSRIRAACSE